MNSIRVWSLVCLGLFLRLAVAVPSSIDVPEIISSDELLMHHIQLTAAVPSAIPTKSPRPTNTAKPTTQSPTRSGANVPTAQYQALHDLYIATNGSYWQLDNADNPGQPWDFSSPSANPCLDDWIGISCNGMCFTQADCLVTQLELVGLKLMGYLPASIGNINSLWKLDLSQNFINSTIPDSIGKLHNLSIFSLAQNGLYGTIPDMFLELQNLTRMDLSSSRLSGSLPMTLYNLSKIEQLDFTRASLTGSILDQITNLRYLTKFSVRNNYMVGSIPNNIGSLSQLQYLWLALNYFTGDIPASLMYSKYLISLDLAYNYFTGKVPFDIGTLSLLEELVLQYNYLSGTFPASFVNLVNLKRIVVGSNLFTSSLPSSFATIPKLITFDFRFNAFTGKLPDFSMLTRFSFALVDGNYFTGTVPSLYGSPLLFEISTNNNLLTGTLPASSSMILVLYFMNKNFFTGTIPSQLSPPTNLPTSQILALLTSLDIFEYLDPATEKQVLLELKSLSEEYLVTSAILDFNVEYNMLTGTLPAWPMNCTVMTYIYAGDNYLTGTIPDWVLPKSTLAVLSLSNNMLTGTIPASFHQIKSFVGFVVSNNQLTGTIPQFLFHNKKLELLLLQQNRFVGAIPDISSLELYNLVTVELSNNDLTGSIPVSFFHRNLTSLLTFSASANCFTGYIPESICNVTSLQTLVLDGLSTAPSCREPIFSAFPGLSAFTLKYRILGNIPSCLFAMPNLQTMHLSGNGFEGSLPSNLKLNCNLNNLVLSHNQLFGPIPSAIQQRAWNMLDLSYNKLSGTLDADGFENNDEVDCNFHGDNVKEMSNNIHLEVNRLSGTIPPDILSITDISILNDNIFSCGKSTFDKKLPEHDPKASSYSCGSDSVNEAMYLWAGLLGFVAGLGLMVWFAPKEMKMLAGTRIWLEDCYQQILLWKGAITKVERGRFEVDNGQMVYLQNDNPIYLLHKFMKLMRYYALYFIVFLVVICMPVYLGLSNGSGTYVETYAWQISSAFISGYAPGLTLNFLFMLLLSVVYYLYDYRMTQRMRSDLDTDSTLQHSTNRVASSSLLGLSMNALRHNSCFNKETQVLVIVALVNMTLMTLLNVGYIIAVISLKTTTGIGLIRWMMTFLKLYWNEKYIWILLQNTKKFIFRSAITNEEDRGMFARRVTSKDLFLIVFSILFNNNIAPCISIAIVSPACFYNAFVGTGIVQSSYSYCNRYYRLTTLEVFCLETTVGTSSYNPPFIYNYNCANLLPANYVQVYAYMVFISGIVNPLLRLCLKIIHMKFIPKGSKLYKSINWYMVPLLREYQATRFPAEGETGYDYRKSTLFNKNKCIVVLVSYLTLLITFGSVFPPLAIVIWIALCVRTWYEIMLIGRVIYETKQLGYDWYVKQLRKETQGMSELFTPTVLPMTFVAGLLYAYMVYDTTGDTQGHLIAIGPAISLFMFSIAMWPAVRVDWKAIFKRWEEYWFGQKEDARKRKLKSMVADSNMVEMVIQSLSGSRKRMQSDKIEEQEGEEQEGEEQEGEAHEEQLHQKQEENEDTISKSSLEVVENPLMLQHHG